MAQRVAVDPLGCKTARTLLLFLAATLVCRHSLNYAAALLTMHCRPTATEPKGDPLGRNAAAAAAANAKAAKKNAKRALAKQRKAEEAVTGPAGGSSSIAGSNSGQLATGVCMCCYLPVCAMRNELQLVAAAAAALLAGTTGR
jgi:hypothetical protein